MDKKISALFDDYDGIVLDEEAGLFDPAEIKEMTMRKIQGSHAITNTRAVRRTGRTLLFAAIIASFLTLTAFAAGLSIHQKRQREVREQLNIDQNQVSDYVEPAVPGEDDSAEGVTLLSTINDGEFQNVFVNVSPVEPEEINSFGRRIENADGTASYYEFSFTRDNVNFGIATPAVLTGGAVSLDDLVAAAYDADSKTLTLQCACIDTLFPFDEDFALTLQLHRMTMDPDYSTEAELIRTFGTVTVHPTGATTRTILFDDPIPFENAVTGGKGQVIGVTLGSMDVDLLVTHDNMETIYERTALEGEALQDFMDEQLGWIRATDALFQGMALTFSDGSTRTGFGTLRSFYENGRVVNRCGLGSSTINISDVVGVTVGGVTIPVTRG
ncbi:MAG: hypothetical protein IJV41_11540 [Oscillospiraceae bacterium]|nr:hypothetical protein [Oscillospiraceae bacterium]